MSEDLKKIIFSPEILNVFNNHNWIININSKGRFHSHFVGDIADYHLNIYNDTDKLCFQFTLDIQIPKYLLQELLMLINIANQNSKSGFFVFDHKFQKINYNLIPYFSLRIEERSLNDFLKNKLDFIERLFHNFVLGIHNIIYGEKVDVDSLELLFLNHEGYA